VLKELARVPWDPGSNPSVDLVFIGKKSASALRLTVPIGGDLVPTSLKQTGVALHASVAHV
jgi:hypothetical protein